jgi:hypothetical protein
MKLPDNFQMREHSWPCQNDNNIGAKIGTTFIGCPKVADDISMILYHPEDLQHALHIVHNETRRDKVTINSSKSDVIIRWQTPFLLPWLWLEKIGLQSLSPIFEIKIIASYSKMQEAHFYNMHYTLYTMRLEGTRLPSTHQKVMLL